MSQRVSNIQNVFSNPDTNPALTANRGGISGIEDGSTPAIVLRQEIDGPSGINNLTPPVIVTPSFTVT